jgi:MYXO-CTERM domain-containing protein
VIEFEIDASGKVTKADVGESALTDASVGRCMTGMVKRWKFPKPRGGGSVSVSYPFTLAAQPGSSGSRFGGRPSPFVLTRLHARYDQRSLGEDLVFRAADPIIGGREIEVEPGKLERGASPSPSNNFQGRYVIRHPWTGPVECEKPQRGIWGGPWEGEDGSEEPVVAKQLTKVARGASLASFVTTGSAAQLGLDEQADVPAKPPEAEDDDEAAGKHGSADGGPSQSEKPPGCGCASADSGDREGARASLLGLLALAGLRRRRADA